jgi:hypothetical protein
MCRLSLSFLEHIMMFRAIVGRTALGLGLLLSLSISPIAACEGAGCGVAANTKPLNIMQFMREQAASTRVNERPRDSAAATAKIHRAPHNATAVRRKPVRMPGEAAASFASQQAPNVQQTAIDERKIAEEDAISTETTGAAVASDPDVQLVDAAEYNEIDRKTDNGTPLPADAMSDNDTLPNNRQTNNSWLQWIWSALGNTFAALAMAVRQLVHV